MVCLLLGEGMQYKYGSRQSTLIINLGLDACQNYLKIIDGLQNSISH